jgi:uncharacterized protein (DUF885 family)
MRTLLSLCALALLATPVWSATKAPGDAALTALADEFIQRQLTREPGLATRLGVHDSDAKLYPVTQATLADDARWFHDFEQRLMRTDRKTLSLERALEYDLLLSRTRARLLDLEVIKPFERNPNAYLNLIAGSVQGLLQRDFANVCDRLRSASARLRQVPEVLRAAQINLSNPPRIYTEVAIGQYGGALRFYREVVPQMAASCKDPAVLAELAEADSGAVRAVEGFLSFLREDLLSRSKGEYAIGRDTYQKKLLYDEMVTTPVESLLARGMLEIATTHAQMESLANVIRPGATARQVLDEMGRLHPRADSLVSYTAAQLDRIRAFVRGRDLLTVPEKEDLRVRETPIFNRSLSFASMDSPGVWEKKANEAFYNVTPPDAAWDSTRREDHMSFFNRYGSEVVSIHEALPGHYYQFMALRRSPYRLRQMLTCGTYTEGWAHYCEQMMLEQGYGGDDPHYRMAQLSHALQRLCRLVAGISMHTQGMTVEQATALFRDDGYMTQVNAEREARRGTSDPTYLVYTVGKWEILALRDEMKAKQGASFSLKAFNNELLRQGASPLPIVRQAMLAGVAK